MAPRASRWPCSSCTPRRDERNSWTLPEVRSPTRKRFSTRSLGNWPDLRGVDEPGSPPRPISYGRAWCHGAPGIALARLRARMLDPSRGETYENLARAGLATTLEAIDKNLRDPDHDTSLCHGLGGLMDIVLTAGMLLEDECLPGARVQRGEGHDRPTRPFRQLAVGARFQRPEPVAHAGLRGSRLFVCCACTTRKPCRPSCCLLLEK